MISPLLSNIYLTEVDRMLERARKATRYAQVLTSVEYARFPADDLVILIDAYPRHDWLMGAVEKRRCARNWPQLQVEINEERSSEIVDLRRGGELRLSGVRLPPSARSAGSVWRAHYTPKLKKRTALLRKLKLMCSAATNRNRLIGS